jgi:hypothetical protein
MATTEGGLDMALARGPGQRGPGAAEKFLKKFEWNFPTTKISKKKQKF